MKLAVAFWGAGAWYLLPNSKEPIQIICNLDSGATNPFLVEKLFTKTNISIRNSPKLHAKVYLSSDLAIVGSANVSSNGLSLEDQETDGWIEASIVTEEANQLKLVDKWFDETWDSSNRVSKTDIENAKKNWLKRRNSRAVSISGNKTGSLLTELKRNPLEFKDRKSYFLIIRHYANKEEETKFKEIEPQFGKEDIVSYHTNWSEIPEGAFFVELYWGKRGHFQYDGIFETPGRRILIPFKYDNAMVGNFAICFRRDSIDNLGVISEDDINLLAAKVKDLWESEAAMVVDDDHNSRMISIFDAKDILSEK